VKIKTTLPCLLLFVAAVSRYWVHDWTEWCGMIRRACASPEVSQRLVSSLIRSSLSILDHQPIRRRCFLRSSRF
jgi:hypothetical protein